MKARRFIRRRAALVSVLCLIFTAGILTAAVLSLSKIGTFTVAAHVELQRSMLVAEGVAARVQWLLAADRNLNPDDKPGSVEYETFEYDRFMADGVEHELDYYGETVRVQVFDAVSGWDMSASNYANVLSTISSQEDAGEDLVDQCEEVSQLIADYLDSDDNIRERGMEAGDYEDDMRAPLPRNGTMLFREELLYIRGLTDIIPLDSDGRLSAVRLIPPAGTSSLEGSPTLFNATREEIKLRLSDLDEDGIDNVMDALKQWRTEKVLLSESLDEEILTRLNSAFSTSESGAYTVVISGPRGEGTRRPFRKLVFTYAGFEVSGPTDQMLKYMEWNFL